jgi:hypothetical protein
MKKVLYIALLGLFMMLAMGDDCGGPPPPPPVGFQVHTMDEQGWFGTLEDAPYISLTFYLEHLVPAPPQGFITSFNNVTTDGSGYFDALNAEAPAVWNFQENNGPCGGQSVPANVGQNQTQVLDCIGFAITYTMTPSTLDVLYPPANLQIFGAGMTTTYGMPQVQIFNSLGNVVGQTTATAVTNNGTQLTAPTPDLHTLRTDTYGIRVMNVQSGGSLVTVGELPVDVDGDESRGGGCCGEEGGPDTRLPPPPC